VDRFWDRLIGGESGVGPITRFDTEDFDVRFGGECSEFEEVKHFDRQGIKRMDRVSQFAVVAARQAMTHSGIDISKEDPSKFGACIGSGIGGLLELELQMVRLLEKGPSKVSAFTIPKLMVNASSGNISIEFGLEGPSTAIATACASATDAMGAALEMIRLGRTDVMITGGSEAALTQLGLSAFSAMKALSTRNDAPQSASRPFDRDRDGFVLGEGAGVLVFEELNHARNRGADILVEVLGCGQSADAFHLTQPMEDGRGAATSMQFALKDAGISPDSVDYINAHGTSTPLGDLAETTAVKRVFGASANKLVVNSTKSSIGHLLGGSGGVELIATIQAIKHNVAPPTINLDNPGPGCDLDYVAKEARDMRIDTAISNSFGFGGHNGTIAVGRFSG
jgi:3-oxoacyl-[acyl-carrier-protein] synthase II